ncbi:MAG: ABC transporter substrate-binding (seleno)protein SaoB [Syntrophomonadaceae bacterium]
MKSGRKIAWTAETAFIFILVLAFLVLPGEKRSSSITIGVPDDSASYIFRYLIDERGVNGQVKDMLAVYPIKDCCTSTSEWALSTDNLDMSVICPDAAERLLAKDHRYIIIGSCRINSDVLVQGSSGQNRIIGITQNRNYQADLAWNYCGTNIEVYPMLGSALPYALNTGKIDGAVMDIAGALRLGGQKVNLSAKQDTVTYVLVAQKHFLKQDAFKEFIGKYNQAVQELQDQQNLQRVIEKYAGYPCSGKEASEWKRMNVQYLLLTTPVIS